MKDPHGRPRGRKQQPGAAVRRSMVTPFLGAQAEFSGALLRAAVAGRLCKTGHGAGDGGMGIQ
jgi:hypothetical protein